MYSGLFGKRRSVSGAAVDPAQSRMVLGGEQIANCTGCKHCVVFSGPRSVERLDETCESYVCMADEPPRQVGTWLTVRPDWCPVSERMRPARPSTEGLAGGQGRDAAETTAAADALQIAGLVGFMVFICWCLTSCGDLGRLVR